MSNNINNSNTTSKICTKHQINPTKFD